MTMKGTLTLLATVLLVLGLCAGSAFAKGAPTKFSRLDPSYGVHGSYAVATPKSEGQLPDSVHLVLASSGEAYVLQGRTLLAFSPDGKPDHGFGKNGRIWVNPGPGQVRGMAGIAVDPQGRVLVAGTYVPVPGFANPLVKGTPASTVRAEPSEAFVARYLPDGTVDSTFGSGGAAFTTFGVPRPTDFPGGKAAEAEYEKPSVAATQLLVDSQGRPVVGGAYVSAMENCGWYASFTQSFVARMSATGAPEPSFGGTGHPTLPGATIGELAGGPGGELAAISSQTYPCSEHSPGSGPYWTTSVLTEDGALSPTLDPARPMVGAHTGLAVDSQGRILLTEWDNPSGIGVDPGGQKVIRLLPNGDLDPSFGFDGAANLKRFDLGAPSLAVDAKGRTVVAFGGTEPRLIRISSAGKLDHGFSKKTVLHVPIERVASTDTEAVAIDPKGRIVVAGLAQGGALKTGFGVGIARVLPGG